MFPRPGIIPVAVPGTLDLSLSQHENKLPSFNGRTVTGAISNLSSGSQTQKLFRVLILDIPFIQGQLFFLITLV